MKEKIKCELCNKEYSKKGIGTHIWRVHGDGKKHNPNIGYKTKKRKIWNKGLTKENNKIIKKQSETLKQKYNNGELIHPWLGRKHTKKTLKKLKKNGGVRKGAGRGKSGWYKGYWCDSSYELVYVIYNLEHNLEFERNNEGFEYIFEGKKYKYYPDFIIDDTYIEIKGYLNKQTEQKIKQFKKNLIVLYKKDIQYMFDYVIEKYGKDFIKLYE